ncbi:MAG: transaldolase family protein [Candidatus Krumholzibacteriia bacterium]
MISSSESVQIARALEPGVREWVLQGFKREFGKQRFESDPRWQAVCDTGTELWLDTGDIEGIRKLWKQEFRALTTNNTLLNKEVQRGLYDDFVRETAAHLRKLEPSIPDNLFALEIAFVLNAYHGLRLVENFDAFVSVEEHTDLANDIELTVLYGKRFHAICPERFFVKVPLTPEGLLAMRRLRQEQVPINFTLGFSARQNYMTARIGNPNFVNVFLGRLNSFVSDSGLGSGEGVGEKATAASQETLRALRDRGQVHTRQIAASMRSGDQIWTLAGTDVMTIPLAAAEQYHDSEKAPPMDPGLTSADIQAEVDADALRKLHFECLWDVPDALRDALDALSPTDLDHMSGPELQNALRNRGVVDLLPEYTSEELDVFRADGKIPKLEHWRQRLEAGTAGLDSLLNMSGLHSFASDQKALDDRVRGLLG